MNVTQAIINDASLIHDLPTALNMLEQHGEGPEVIIEPVQSNYEVAAYYAARGGGVPVAAPTKAGRSILFERVIPANKPVVVGLFGTRKRCSLMLGCEKNQMADFLLEAMKKPIKTEVMDNPPCQEIIHDTVDLNELPILKMTKSDAGPFITLGLVMAKHPVTKEVNISVHRLWVKGNNELTIWMVPGRHLESFYLAAKERGENLPISINIGMDPAIYFASCLTGASAPIGCNELTIAGGIRGRSIFVSPCIYVDADCISESEIVLEGELTHEYTPEGELGGQSMPEFLGYDGQAHPNLPIVRIQAITSRKDAVYQTVIGPGYEQSNLLAIGMEASVLSYLRDRSQAHYSNAYCSSAGGGQLLLFLQVQKGSLQDDEEIRLSAVELLQHFRMLKQIVLVDEDVNIFSEEEMWWAMTTRFQADSDILTLSNVEGFHLDPSQRPGMSPNITAPGMTSKVVFDCTVPFEMKPYFKRTSFK